MNRLKNISIIFLLSSFLFSFIISCDSTDPKPPEKPPGYQEDIPWPSLADSPWPMNNADPQNTGRSDHSYLLNGVVEKAFRSSYGQSGVSLKTDSSFLFLAADSLFNYHIDGTLIFKKKIAGSGLVTPLIDRNGNIYTASTSRPEFYILDGSGEIKHKVTLDAGVSGPLLNVDLQGNVYCLDINKNLYSISSDGVIKWTQSIPEANPFSFGISFSPDGNHLYIAGESVNLISINTNSKQVEWTFGDTEMYNSPLVDSNGNIFLLPYYENTGPSKFISLNSSGSENWNFEFINSGNAMFFANSPTIDKLGNIYFATDTLYSLSYKGTPNWKVPLVGFSDSHLVADDAGNVFVGTMQTGEKIFITSFDVRGNILWQVDIPQSQVGGSPAIGYNRLVYPSWRGSKLYLIR